MKNSLLRPPAYFQLSSFILLRFISPSLANICCPRVNEGKSCLSKYNIRDWTA